MGLTEVNPILFIWLFCLVGLVLLEPLQATLVGQVLNRKLLERRLKAIVRDTPVVALRGNIHRERIALYRPALRLVEPLHSVDTLRREGGGTEDECKGTYYSFYINK